MLRNEVSAKLDDARLGLWDFLTSAGPDRPLAGLTISVGGINYKIDPAAAGGMDPLHASLFLTSPKGDHRYEGLDDLIFDMGGFEVGDKPDEQAPLLRRLEATRWFWGSFSVAVANLPNEFPPGTVDSLHSGHYLKPFLQQLTAENHIRRALDSNRGRTPLEYAWHSIGSFDSPSSITFTQSNRDQLVIESIHGLTGIRFKDAGAEALRRHYLRIHTDFMNYLGVPCVAAPRDIGGILESGLAAALRMQHKPRPVEPFLAAFLIGVVGYASYACLPQPPSGSSLAAATPTPAVSATPMAATQVAASTPVPVSTPQAVAPLVPGVLGRDYHLGLPVVPYGEQTSRRYSVNAPIVPSGNLPGLPTPAASPAPRAGQGFLPVVPASYTSK